MKSINYSFVSISVFILLIISKTVSTFKVVKSFLCIYKLREMYILVSIFTQRNYFVKKSSVLSGLCFCHLEDSHCSDLGDQRLQYLTTGLVWHSNMLLSSFLAKWNFRNASDIPNSFRALYPCTFVFFAQFAFLES